MKKKFIFSICAALFALQLSAQNQLPPVNVSALLQDSSSVDVSWSKPGTPSWIAYCGNVQKRTLGSTNMFPFTFAIAYDVDQINSYGLAGASIEKVEVYCVDPNANYVFKIYQTNGSANSPTPEYTQEIPDGTFQKGWNTVVLNTPFTIKNTEKIYIAFTGSNYILGPAAIDVGPSISPNSFYWLNTGITWQAMVDHGINGNVLLKAFVRYANSAIPSGYITYRTTVDKVSADKSEWTVLATGLTDTTYTDADYHSLTPNSYVYGVSAKYGDTSETKTIFSSPINKDMEFDVYVRVKEPQNGKPLGNVTIQLANDDHQKSHSYTMLTNSSGLAHFSKVWAGNYFGSVVLTDVTDRDTFSFNLSKTTGDVEIELELNEKIEKIDSLRGILMGDYAKLLWAAPKVEGTIKVDVFEEGGSPSTFGYYTVSGGNPENPLNYAAYNPYLPKDIEKSDLIYGGIVSLAAPADLTFVVRTYRVVGTSNIASRTIYSQDLGHYGIGTHRFENINFAIPHKDSAYLIGFIAKNYKNQNYPQDSTTPLIFIKGLRDAALMQTGSDDLETVNFAKANADLELSLLTAGEVDAHPKHYNIYADNQYLTTTTALNYQTPVFPIGEHTFGIRAVYQTDSSEMAELSMDISGLVVDVKPVEIVTPKTTADFGTSKDVTIKIQNKGTDTVYNINVAYFAKRKNNVLTQANSSEVCPGPIAPNSEIEYTFSKKASINKNDTNTVTFYIVATSERDIDLTNDTLFMPIASKAEPSVELSKTSIYPNPTTGLLYVNCEIPIEIVRIYNVMGQLIEERRISNNTFEYDIKSLTSGIYFIELVAKDGKITRKISKY